MKDLEYTFIVNVLKSTSSIYIQNMIENMTVISHASDKSWQIEVDMSKAMKCCPKAS